MTIQHKPYINVNSLEGLAKHGIKRAVIAIGVFDGVHLGHQALITSLLQMAKQTNATPVAFTFYPHPRQVLQPDSPPSLLVPPFKKLELLHEAGVEALVTIPFSREFAALAPDTFIHECLLSDHVELCGICVGKEWRFGAKGSGDVSLLEKFAAQGHFDFIALDELTVAGKTISSTAIRRAISSGNLTEAASMLGRPYSLIGTVVTGQHVAGTELAHPTANLAVEYGIVPPNGVYAGKALYDDKEYISAVAIGVAPTFRHQFTSDRKLEVHLLDFTGDLYGMQLEVQLHSYVREERCYSSSEVLKKQIDNDIAAVRRVFEE